MAKQRLETLTVVDLRMRATVPVAREGLPIPVLLYLICVIVPFGFSLGPNLVGVSQHAATRVEGLDAAAYIHQSILDPHSYIVAGYRDIMYPDYSKYFDEQDMTDLIAFLMAL